MEKKYIKTLLKLANKARRNDESPIAAIIVYKNKIIAKAYNRRRSTNLTISHAEIDVISKANKKLGDWRLNNCTLYVTMKPCEMCEKVIKEARIDKVYYLVERESFKRQYDKTQIIKHEGTEHSDYIKKYTTIIKNFWKNKR